MGFGIAKHPVSVLMVGLDNSGKTSIVDWLASRSTSSKNDTSDEQKPVTPTVGFRARRVNFGRTPITVLDMSGQGRYRNLWRYYLRQCDGIVFVVDGVDGSRLPVAFAELRLLLSDHALVRRRPCLPLLLLANKSDRAPSADSNFRRNADDLCAGCYATRRPCHVVACSSLTGAGLIRGFEWLLEQMAVAKSAWRRDTRPTWY